MITALQLASRIVTKGGDLEEALGAFCEPSGYLAADALVAGAEGLTAAAAVAKGSDALRDACASVRLLAGQALAGRALERQAPLWSADLAADPRAAMLSAAGVRSAIACPVAGGGAVELFSGSAEPAGADALAEAETLAALLAPLFARPSGFEAVFERIGVGLAMGTAEGRFVRVNRACAAFLGYEPQELAGRNVREFLVPDAVASTLQTLRALDAREVDRVDLERQYLRRDGTHVWGRTTVTRLEETGLLIGVVQDIDARKRAEAEVRKLSGRFLHLQDEERRRIARSLHESAAQTVAALSMNLQRMERMALPQHAAEVLADSLTLATEASREIRTLSHLLHPPLLEEAGLPSSLSWYTEGFAKRSNVEVELWIADDVRRLPMELEITLFRIVQESLTNVHRHSGSRRASVRLRRSGPEVVLEVADEGAGIPPQVLQRIEDQSSAAPGVGIAGMRERLSQLGGTLEIVPANPGTVVRARIRSE